MNKEFKKPVLEIIYFEDELATDIVVSGGDGDNGGIGENEDW